MFENSLYEPYRPETVATPTEEGDLFHGYEIKTWDLGPRIYKILGASAIVNVIGLIIFAQGSLLTMKGCDSPLVGGVCQVLDTVYVGAMLFGTDREYVDAAYDPTDLGDAEITFVDVSGVTPPISYPEGYFQIANPVEYQAMLDAVNNPTDMGFIAPGIPMTTPSTGGSLFDTTPNIPKQNPTIIDGDLPSGFGNSGVASNPTTRKGRTRKPPLATDDTVAKAGDEKPADKPTEPKVDPTAPLDPNAVNTRPTDDLMRFVNGLIDSGQYKLDSQFSMSAKAKLSKDGKFEKGTFKMVKAESPDRKTMEVVQKALEALADSGRLKVLSEISGKDLNVSLSQDATNLNAVVASEMETAMRANSVKSSFDLAISLAKEAKSGENADQNDKDDLLLLENVKVETDGKKVILTFLAPKELLLPMIQRKLAEQKAKEKPQNGNSSGSSLSNTAQKK